MSRWFGLKVAAQHGNLIDSVVTPVHRCRPSVLILRTVRLPNGPAVAAVEREQVRFFSLMIEQEQVAGDDW